MKAQPDLFAPARSNDDRDKRKLRARLISAAKGGLVNGMSKEQLRRRHPRTLPPITKDR